MKEKILKKYKNLLPQHLTVSMKKTKMGLVAEIKELPHCYTQARDFIELIEMINDAVFTYLDIPTKHREALGIYLPETIINEIKRIRLEQAFRDLVKQPFVSKSFFSKRSEI